MSDIIGEPFLNYVNDQINERQTAHGSKNRNFNQLAYLNSKTAWVKLASSVKIDGTFKSTDPEIKSGGWDELAKKYVLFSGFSSLNGSILSPREEVFDKYSSKSFGLVPMPGIVDASVKCENRGSIKKATVNIKCYSPEQFRILEVLYLRLGYTVFLEFGWSSYLDGGTLKNTSSTLIETEFFNLTEKSKYVDFLKKIEAERKNKKGNYDGLLCKVSNFSWTFSQDGSYDIELSLITMGDVIESLKTNVKPSKEIVDFISEKYPLYGSEVAPITEDGIGKNTPPAPAQNLISAYLFLQRLYLQNFKEDNLNNILFTDKEFFRTFYNDDAGMTVNGDKTEVPNFFIKQGDKIKANSKSTDFIYFNYGKGGNISTEYMEMHNEGFYIRFGHLIQFIRDNIIIKSKVSKEPIIEIDKDFEKSKMYAFPFQVSLDPRVCIVGTKEKISQKTFFSKLPVWNDMKGFGANIANIYLNGAMISRVLGEKQDEEGNVSLYETLNSICSELNKALGNINNLETIIDEETNSIKIIDSSFPPPPKTPSAKLELYGYNGNKSNFVYDFKIKTEITNDFATMVTIGATAGGYVKGTENTMFSKWNKGLEDIFKEDYIPPKQTGDEDDDPPNNVYASEFWLKRYAAYGLTYPNAVKGGLHRPDVCVLSPEIIDKNLELVSEFYKYCQYKIQQQKQKYASPTNGFIPISLGITLEGISGIKIYNAVNVDTRFLPSNYPNNLNFIIKGVNHKISNGGWETNLETVVIAKNEKEGLLTYSQIKGFVKDEILKGVAKSKPNSAELTPPIPSIQVEEINTATVTARIAAALAGFQPTINPVNPDGSPNEEFNGPIIPNKETPAGYKKQTYGGIRGDLFSWVKGYNYPNPTDPKNYNGTNYPNKPDFNEERRQKLLTFQKSGYILGITNSGESSAINRKEDWVQKLSTPTPQVDPNKEQFGAVKYKTMNYTFEEQQKMYKDILAGIGGKSTKHNLLWMKLWRDAEGASATHNPWNSIDGTGALSKYNASPGVKNYSSYTAGVNATIKTLTNGNYPTIIKALRVGLNSWAELVELAKLVQRWDMDGQIPTKWKL